MHPNPIFRKAGDQKNIDFARSHGFGILAVNAEQGPLLSHVPFVLSPDGNYLEAHLVRSNPVLKLLDNDCPAVLAISGSHGYVSPDWYEIEDQVPTWNYVAVHLRGSLMRLPDDQLHGILERLSAQMEERLAPKKAWTIEKMEPVVYQRMQLQIVPVAMKISRIDGTWKLSQNKTDEVRLRAAAAMAETGFGSETAILADLMREAE
jgi:transcriptional regulator